MSQKVSNAFKTIDSVINEFSPNDVSSHLKICDHSIVKIGIWEKCIVLSNTSYVDSEDSFKRSVVDKVKNIYVFYRKFMIQRK